MKEILETLDSFKTLQWEEAINPSHQLIENVKFFVSLLRTEPYQVAPGPNGEISLEFRNKEKSIEILFYPDFTKYVDIQRKLQGDFKIEMLDPLLSSIADTPEFFKDIDPDIQKALNKRFKDL